MTDTKISINQERWHNKFTEYYANLQLGGDSQGSCLDTGLNSIAVPLV